ncbi:MULTISPECIES: cytochrome c oxidase, cbb3-type, CcoQ subunit [unclassified Campylobacter]|uniref:cytochrome c oxidase, cbb3-type, CcoQ subunit n=1 Tax=unclassified Campylobacter TaxID=2593542 RepID=UPI001237F5F1|nr:MULTISPECIES: cytochrome c oxidase, cbb3-type, CcoQ subunit [unclassified Campylobacter]KAA6224600.1 cytochrome c oxidase, cbb3-type, CcoQ subunit [Campylobacter sp. LR185c]KAA6224842.1 cytochrome c oxidase, cbb3-type, CcoQ subunit [Campylobacter sp. LR286c]KAA6227989.1 cytochrome c oxidase, cbb3-type, CcoQ subunit [Campylobacter sp. LR196d]KAA6233470.1 cytochrome c oxidase, cbb3-type, CcoQ subunit [Campylobacter sp. LR291e]KAA6234407.1 cytochrome c oxidase, cbb3-type, CcoQ subunit [Campylo
MGDLEVVFGVVKNLLTLNLSAITKGEWEIFQGYGFFFLVLFLVVVLYSYWFHLYKNEKKGERNYEKYAKLALDDEIDDSVLEKKRSA